jgi:hypothetical protein
MEREAQQPALAAGGDPPRDVEERFVDESAVANDSDAAPLLGDKEPAAAVARVRDRKRVAESADDRLERETDAGRVERTARRG